MTASAQGIDVSADQDQLTAGRLSGLSFCFTKATNGGSLADPHFAGNWQVMKDAGIHRGAYHELVSAAVASPQAQADYFLSVVVGAGLEAGDMLAVVVSDYPGVTDAEVKTWCDTVKAAAPLSPVLVYCQGSDLGRFPSCTGYDLWVAAWSDAAPESVAPWKTWKLWQWASVSVDQDAFNGGAAELDTWIAGYAGKPAPSAPHPVPDWQEAMMQHLPEVAAGSADAAAVRTVQGLCVARGHLIAVDGSYGPQTELAVRNVQSGAGIGVDGVVGPVTWPVLLGV
jgi:lysozyme